MTDLLVFRNMLLRANIKFTEEIFPRGDESATVISIEAGYVGFFSIICFKGDGSLEKIEAYE